MRQNELCLYVNTETSSSYVSGFMTLRGYGWCYLIALIETQYDMYFGNAELPT